MIGQIMLVAYIVGIAVAHAFIMTMTKQKEV